MQPKFDQNKKRRRNPYILYWIQWNGKKTSHASVPLNEHKDGLSIFYLLHSTELLRAGGDTSSTLLEHDHLFAHPLQHLPRLTVLAHPVQALKSKAKTTF
jgi:hypothetical protein